MKYNTDHMALNLLRWRITPGAGKRRHEKSTGTKLAKALLKKMEAK
jgi:hypothetical protein